MRSLLIVLALILTLFTQAQTGTKNFIDQNYIEVTGKAELNVVPDEIFLKILISEKDTKNKISVTA
ncbi:MAG: hypothetical protein PF517_05735 [Salinivirgaceae bacterium]|jgi:uncharacterized protein YggE|nr:hypothetical protein [Salinivirgaceae bacterium]